MEYTLLNDLFAIFLFEASLVHWSCKKGCRIPSNKQEKKGIKDNQLRNTAVIGKQAFDSCCSYLNDILS